MKQIYVSGLGIFLCLPVFAGSRLPAVNVGAAAISARAQYGVPPKNVQVATTKTMDSTGTVAFPAETKKVVARVAIRPAVDRGEKIAAQSDFLTPSRPSSDLWAKVDTPLRMPRADEFSVITSNATLPEETIAMSRAAAPVHTATPIVQDDDINTIGTELDAQIARLVELQRQAEESVRVARSNSARGTANRTSQSVQSERPIVQNTGYNPTVETYIYPAESVAVNTRMVHDNGTQERVIKSMESVPEIRTENDVKISRMVVPMDEPVHDDVVMRRVAKNQDKSIQSVREDMTKMSPSELRRAFRKTFLSENKHLSTYPIDNRFDVVSDMSSGIEGFTSERDLSEASDKIRPLEIKIGFRNADASLSRDSYNLLSEYAGIVVANPKRAIQVAIPVAATETSDSRKLAARRLAIVEQVLRDTGVSEQRIVPILSERNEEGFVLRIISNEQFETLTKQTRNGFGDKFGSKVYKSMSW